MYFFWIPASIAEAAAVIPNGAKTFFAKAIATFINGPANLLNNDHKNPPDWIILEIWALESFTSVYILLFKAFPANSCGKLFPLNIFEFFLKVVPVLFLTAVLRFFNWASDNLTFTLLYSTIYM